MYPPQVTQVTMNRAVNQINPNTGKKRNRSNQPQNNLNNNKIHQSVHNSSQDNQTNLNQFPQRNPKFKSKSNRRNYRSNNSENYYSSNYQNSNVYLTDKQINSNKYSDNKYDRIDYGNKQFYDHYHNQKQFNGKQFDKPQWLAQQFGSKIEMSKYTNDLVDDFVRDKQILNKQLEKEQLERQIYEKQQIYKQNKRLQEIEDAMKDSQKNNEANQSSAHQVNQLNTNHLTSASNSINFALSTQFPIDESQINLQNQINAQIDAQLNKKQVNLPNNLKLVNASQINNRSTNGLMNDSNLSSTNVSFNKSINHIDRSLDRSISNSSGNSIDKSFNKPNRAITKQNGNVGSLSTQKLPAGTGPLINGFCTNTNNDLIPIDDSHKFKSNIGLTNGNYTPNSQFINSHAANGQLLNNNQQFINSNQMINGQLFTQLINNPHLYGQLPTSLNLNDLMKITDLKSLNKNLEDKLNASLNASKSNQFYMIPNGPIECNNNNSSKNSTSNVNEKLNKSTNHSNCSDQMNQKDPQQLKNPTKLEPAVMINEQQPSQNTNDIATDDIKINKKQTKPQLNRQNINQSKNNHQVNSRSIIDNQINIQIDNQIDYQNDSQSSTLNSSNSTQQSSNVRTVKQIKSEVRTEPEKFNKRSNGYFNGYHNNHKERNYKGDYRPKYQNEYCKQNEYNKQTESKYRGNYGKYNKTYSNNNQPKATNMFPVSHSSSYPKLIHNDIVSSQIWKTFLFLRQTPRSYQRKIELRQILYDALREHFPNNLYVVGSSLNGLGTNTSDVDMCLLLPDQVGEIDQIAQAIPILKIVEGIVRNLHFIDPNKIKLIEAKVPILKFWDRDNNIEIDLNINNIVGIRNTQLIRCYTKLDWRVQPLAITVKAWAHRNDIKNAHKKTISSYTLVLMLIHYLQVGCSPAVLPCLHKLMPAHFQTDSDVRKLSLYEETPEFKSKNDQSLSELLLGFLDYYGNKFDYVQDVISIRQGATMKKEIAKEFRSSKNTSTQWRFICCEEPFDRTNTARSVSDYESFMRIIRVFKESYAKLKQTGNLLCILNFDHILFNKNPLLNSSNNLSLNSLNSDLRSQSPHSIYSNTTSSVHSSQSNLLVSNDSTLNSEDPIHTSHSNNASQNSTLTKQTLVT